MAKKKGVLKEIIKIGPQPQPSIGGDKSPSAGIAFKKKKNRLLDRLS